MSVTPLEDAPVQLVMKASNVLVAKVDTSKMALIAKAAIVIQVEVMAKNVAPMDNVIVKVVADTQGSDAKTAKIGTLNKMGYVMLAIVIAQEVMAKIVAPMANAIADLGLKENVVMTVLLVMLAINVTDVSQGILDILISKVSLVFAL